MPGFMDIATGGWKVWGLIVSTVLVVIGGGLTIYDQASGGGLSQRIGDLPLKCTNPSCDWSDAVSLDKKTEMAKKDYDQWKIDHPGKQPVTIDQMAIREMSISSDVQSPEQAIEKMVLLQWGTLRSNLPISCPKCSQKSVFVAKQCPKCGNIFFDDNTKNPPDTCPNPKCGFSVTQARREASSEKAKETKRPRR
jgi:hypothetical protein